METLGLGLELGSGCVNGGVRVRVRVRIRVRGVHVETLGLGLDWGGAMVHMETSCGVILGILDGVWVLPPLAPRLPCLPLTAS